ncbi:MAG TPA: ABC transporter substrate-binding protein, partial [Clostridia bacterium]|nr:ABC transporter substrate-binding protein [Clostridia bacterium]
MLRRVVSILILSLGLIAFSFAGGQGEASGTAEGQAEMTELKVGISTEPWDLDPATATDTGSYHLLKNIYDPIIEYNEENQLTTEGSLTKEYEWKNENKTLILYLREGVKFHDGSDFTAADVKYNLEWQLNEDNDAPWKGQIGPVSEMNILDEYTLEVTFESPTPHALAMWAGTSMFGVVPEGSHGKRTEEKGVGGKPGTDLTRAPIGTGPYKFVSWRSGSRIVLEKNENYWDKDVQKADQVIFEFIGDPSAKLSALISGSVDIIDKVPFRDYETIKNMPDIETKRMPGTALQILYLNLSNPPIGISEDQIGDEEEIERAYHVRKFLYHAIDREAIADQLFYGMATIAKGPWYPDSEWTSPKLKKMEPYDPESAKEHLQKAGFADGGLSFEMQATNAQWFVDMATIIQEQLRQYGVQSEVVPVDKATLFDTMYESNDWDILVEDWVFSDFSVLSYLGFNYPWNNWSPNHWHHADPDLRDLYHESVPGHEEWVKLH